MTAITSALSALSIASSTTRRPTVRNAETIEKFLILLGVRPWNAASPGSDPGMRRLLTLTRSVSTSKLDLYLGSALTRVSVLSSGYGPRSGSVSHQHGGGDARHASPDAAQVRAPGIDSAVADGRQHASLFTGRTGAPAPDQASG